MKEILSDELAPNSAHFLTQRYQHANFRITIVAYFVCPATLAARFII